MKISEIQNRVVGHFGGAKYLPFFSLLGKTENCTLEGLKLHTFQVNIFDFLGIDQLAIAPEADFG